MAFDAIGPRDAELATEVAGGATVATAATAPDRPTPSAGRVLAYVIVVAGGLLIGAFAGLIASLVAGLISIAC